MNNLMSTLLNNKEKFKHKKPINKYKTMKKYIEKDYSWFKVGELLYNYFQDIVKSQ